MAYRILPLPLAPFQPLFGLSDARLEAQGARRIVADAPYSAPCRVSLVDAEPGERLILAHHPHLANPRSPYRAGGPVFVREAAIESPPLQNAVPAILSRRLLSVRLYDQDGMMLDAEVVEGAGLDDWLAGALAVPGAAEAHVHTARRGCYLARAVRT